jgi:IS5 family transposase
MPKQPAFPVLRDAMKKKQTRRELFLPEMDAVVPWIRLMALITPHYPKAGPKGGRDHHPKLPPPAGASRADRDDLCGGL